ncbi:hypothetical protein [Streptomyces griseoviridis]|uniref:hypothetical protein n=1 Tax=Streptomyces griseoviridis TaxID=45398 RepID=UPI0034258AE8
MARELSVGATDAPDGDVGVGASDAEVAGVVCLGWDAERLVGGEGTGLLVVSAGSPRRSGTGDTGDRGDGGAVEGRPAGGGAIGTAGVPGAAGADRRSGSATRTATAQVTPAAVTARSALRRPAVRRISR